MTAVSLQNGAGLEPHGPNLAECIGALELAASWIVGEAGDEKDQEKNSKVERLVIAGNSLSAETRDRKILSTAKYKTSGQAARSVEAVNAFDEILEEFSSGLEVDVMPGPNDPANQNLPQQPLHCCLFPREFELRIIFRGMEFKYVLSRESHQRFLTIKQ